MTVLAGSSTRWPGGDDDADARDCKWPSAALTGSAAAPRRVPAAFSGSHVRWPALSCSTRPQPAAEAKPAGQTPAKIVRKKDAIDVGYGSSYKPNSGTKLPRSAQHRASKAAKAVEKAEKKEVSRRRGPDASAAPAGSSSHREMLRDTVPPRSGSSALLVRRHGLRLTACGCGAAQPCPAAPQKAKAADAPQKVSPWIVAVLAFVLIGGTIFQIVQSLGSRVPAMP